MKRKFRAGLTSVSLPVFIADTSSTTGGGLSGVTSASSGLVIEYRRAGQSSWTSVTPVAGKTLGTYLSGGIVADGSLAGAYEVDFPDAAFASGARMVVCRIRGVTNMLPSLIEIELDAVDYQDATAFGLSRLDQTIGSRATQTSVNTIPTNPLLTTDTRLDYLDAAISSRSTYAGTDTPGTSQLLGRLTTQRANNLDFLDAAISNVLSTISGLNNLSAKCNLFGSSLLEVPETGSTVYEFNLVVKDDEDKLVNLDTAPTITATNAAGTDRSANLSAVTTVATGRYRFTYTVASTHAKESLRIEASGTVSAEARYAIWNGSVVDYDTTSTLIAIQNNTTDIQSRLPASLVNGRISSYVGEMAPNVITSNSIAVSALNGKGDWALATNWTALRAGYLDLVLLANNSNQRTVTLTGNGHVPSVLHDAEPNSIPEDAFQDNSFTSRILATDAVTEIVTGVWTRDLSTFGANTAGKNLFDTLANTASLLFRIPVATAQLVTDLALMLVGSGTALVKWTVNALSNAPSGGAGGTIVATVAVPQLLEHTAFELDEVIVYRGCHWSFQVQNLGDLGGYTEIWFTLRKRQDDKQSNSALHISLTEGLIIANKSTTVTPSDASLTVSGQNVTIQAKQAVTQFIEPGENYNYDLKGRNAAGQTIMLHESDKFIVKRDVTRKVS